MAALEKKTVILVTHQVEFLSAVDKILVSVIVYTKN
jgi:ABC-type transport system involved in cytochrome bd biosynthesis fused ATPase/permease subunit